MGVPFDVRAYNLLLRLGPQKHRCLKETLKRGLEEQGSCIARRARVLDVGAGYGQLGSCVAKTLNQTERRDRVLLDANVSSGGIVFLEPNRQMLTGVIKSSVVRDLLDGDFAVVLVNSRFDHEVDMPFVKAMTYDLVLASHVLYYLDDWTESVKRLYSLLKPCGTLCILLKSSHSELYAPRMKLTGEGLHWASLRRRFFADDLVEVLHAMCLTPKRDTVVWDLPIPAKWLSGAITIGMKRLLCFLYGIPRAEWDKGRMRAVWMEIRERVNMTGSPSLEYPEELFWLRKANRANGSS